MRLAKSILAALFVGLAVSGAAAATPTNTADFDSWLVHHAPALTAATAAESAGPWSPRQLAQEKRQCSAGACILICRDNAAHCGFAVNGCCVSYDPPCQ